MRRLRLRYLGSYSGYGVEVTQKDPVVEVHDIRAAALLATGYFDDLGGEPDEAVPTETATETTEAPTPAKGPDLPAPEAAPEPEAPAAVPEPITTAGLPSRAAGQAPAGAVPRPQRAKRPPSGNKRRR